MADDQASVLSGSRPASPTSTQGGQNASRFKDTVPPLPGVRRAQTGPYRFHWDPTASRRSGPPSASEVTESRADLASVLDGSVTPKIESIFDAASASASGSLPTTWSSSTNGFNAISTVLNSPHAKPNPLKSSRAPMFSGPSPDLPRLRRKDFEPYLKAIGPEWDRFQKNQKSSLEKQEGNQGPSKAKPRPPLPAIDTVPKVYFEPVFDLTNPRTFALVYSHPTSSSPGSLLPPISDIQSQDQLSQHLDVVEQHLTAEIQARSSSFFAALSNLQSLKAEGAECLSRIGRLKAQLMDVDEKQAKKGLQITKLLKQRDNMDIVRDGVKGIAAVGERVELVKTLVASGGYFEALTMLDELDGILTGGEGSDHTSGFHLGSLIAFRTLPESIRGLSSSIAASLSADLVAFLRADLIRDRHSPFFSESESPSTVNNALHERIAPLLRGIQRTQGLEKAMQSYKATVIEEIKACVRMHLPVSEWDEEDLGGNNPSGLDPKISPSADVKTMPHDAFMSLAKDMFGTLYSRLFTTASHTIAINTLVASLSAGTSLSSTESETLSTLVSVATELANAKASKLLSLRSIVHSQLSLPNFLSIFELSWSFVVKSEVLARRMIVGLRGVVVGQAKSWLSAFHSDRLQRAAKAVEDEVWAQVEVSKLSQRFVDLVVEAAVSDPPELMVQAGLEGPVASPNGSSTAQESNAKLVQIEDRTFFVVAATLDVLELLVDYLKVIANLPLLTTDAMGRIIEFLKAFNSRTCQVVLGAGAMRSAGLKNITAKHLALASQSLSIMIGLVPYIRETVRTHLNPKQAVMLVEFDKLKRDYQEHQSEIHGKLIAIMGDRLSVHCRALQEIKWDIPAAKAGPNAYMEVLVKETVTLHKVLSKYLPDQFVEIIMSQVFAGITHRLSEEYGKIDLPSQEAKTRLLQDAKYLHDKLSALKGVNIPGSMLETVVMEKNVPRKGSPFPNRRPTLPTFPTPPSSDRWASGLGSPLANGLGSPTVIQGRIGSRPGTPTLRAGRSSPSLGPTSPAGRDSPLPRSPLTSPRQTLPDGMADSPVLGPFNTGRQLFSPPPEPALSPPTLLDVAQTPSQPPPTPPKDRRYSLPMAGLGLGVEQTERELPTTAGSGEELGDPVGSLNSPPDRPRSELE